MKRRNLLNSTILLTTVIGTAVALAAWKQSSINETAAAATNQPEYMEAVTAAVAAPHEYRPTSTSIGTVVALRSITLRNELAGTVSKVSLQPGQIVEAGTVLVALDVSVETAELKALEAQAKLADSVLARSERLRKRNAISEEELDRARADRDIARAQIARVRAVIERRTIRAPFKSRIGLSNVHPGQYLNEGTELTTLQGVNDSAYVDFAVEQQIAAGLRQGDKVAATIGNDSSETINAAVVAVDARIDPTTRNATVRIRIDGEKTLTPGAPVRVRVPSGPSLSGVSIPANALRKSPAGDHVFVIQPDQQGNLRAHLRPVTVLALPGNEVIISKGLTAGENVAASGSFKLREGVLLAITNNPANPEKAGS